MTQYWVIRGGERRGPYEESDVLEGVELGTVRPNDLLWVEGMREGVPITEVIANLGAAPPSRPPLTLEPLASGKRGASPYRPPSARVDDLAGLALGNISYAGFWVRFAASLLDGFLLLVIAVGIGAAIALVTVLLGFPLSALRDEAWTNLIGVVLSWLYFATLESGPRCATYGKRAFHLQVLGADDLTRIGFLRASARWLGRLLSTFLLMIGYLMQPFTPRKRALHDYIAGTVVVVQAEYSRGLVVTVIVLAFGIPVVLGALFGAGLAGRERQSTLAPETLTTLAHFSMSRDRNPPNSSGLICIGTAPCLAKSAFTSGCARTFRISAFSRSTIGFGVPAGAMIPSQITAS